MGNVADTSFNTILADITCPLGHPLTYVVANGTSKVNDSEKINVVKNAQTVGFTCHCCCLRFDHSQSNNIKSNTIHNYWKCGLCPNGYYLCDSCCKLHANKGYLVFKKQTESLINSIRSIY